MNGLSYSNYTALRRCGQFYKLSVLDKIPQPMQVHFEFGSALHAGLNTALETHDQEAAMDVFQAYWESVAGKGMTYERHSHDQLGEMGVKFSARFTAKYARDMKLITGEKRMFAKFSLPVYGLGSPKIVDYDLEGTPDALVEWGGKNVLLDFKSSAYNYEPEKTDISLQLNLYAWLLEQNGFKVDEMCYFVFNKGTTTIQTPYRVPYDRAKAVSMIEDMVAYFARNVGYYEKNPTACIMGKQVCPYFSKCFSAK